MIASRLMLALRFAAREMRAGLRGFFVFLACIALGVGAIGAVGSVARSISDGVAREGRTLLGGDIRFSLNQRLPDLAEHDWLASIGALSESQSMRSMARRADGTDQALVEVKAVDELWPLYGAAESTPAYDFATLGAEDQEFGALAPQILFDRLSLDPGGSILLGKARFVLKGVLAREPDAASDGFGFAPRLLISREGLAATGLVQPGSLFEHVVKVKIDSADDARVAEVKAEAEKRFPQAGWGVRTRDNAAPALTRSIGQLSQFLSLLGLAALITGGVGVANAARAHLTAKRSEIATLKSLGASGAFVFAVYLAQMMFIAVIGVAIGLALAALAPFALSALLADLLPVAAEARLYPGVLALAALFGLLVTLLFAILPLGRARDVPATALFRELGLDAGFWPKPLYLVAAALLAAALAGLAILTADDWRLAGLFLAGVVFAFVVLTGVGWLVRLVAARTPRPEGTVLRLAVGNIHRPGALTSSVVLSLGLGLTLIVALGLIDGNLRSQISGAVARQAPNFFFLDIQSSDVEAFSTLLAKESPNGAVMKAPMLRGRITALNGVSVDKLNPPPEAQWVLRGDRGITYSPTLPENSTIAEGQWWPIDHKGEPLVSFAAEEGGELGLKLGDSVTINVLGRSITAKIANFRAVKWDSMGINFVMVFSPNTMAGAPHSWLATLADRDAAPADEARLLNAVTRAFPAVTSVRIKDALDVVNSLLRQLATAIRAASSVALVASILVLSGALAAGSHARIRDAVILKTLGATRQTLILAWTLEYGLIGLAAAVFALAAGSAAAWFVTTRIMEMEAQFSPFTAATTIVLALVLTIGFGLIGSWRVLGQKAAPVLRHE
ncbi:MAG: ABC transporter permease [Phyllobacteriaceae bacterium]|nr:ABC transporter permease [Phyllobacteriaceae bacterium]